MCIIPKMPKADTPARAPDAPLPSADNIALGGNTNRNRVSRSDLIAQGFSKRPSSSTMVAQETAGQALAARVGFGRG